MVIQKNRKPPSSSKDSQRGRLSPATTVTADPILSNSLPRAQKRKYAGEDERSQKQPRRDHTSTTVPATASQTLTNILRTTAQKRKPATEDECSQKQPPRHLLSASIPAAASQYLVGISRTRERKGPKAPENQRSGKRRRYSSPLSSLRLSERNLKLLERLTRSNTPYSMETGNATLERTQNRALSRQISQEAASVPSQSSSGTTTERRRKRAPSRQSSVSFEPGRPIGALADVVWYDRFLSPRNSATRRDLRSQRTSSQADPISDEYHPSA